MKESTVFADDKYLRSLDEKARERKESILKSASVYPTGGTVYYVSNSGRDENSGLSPDEAICSLEKVASLPLKKGDAVLFCRGGEWRGQLKTHEGVTYSAYGEGNKPILNGSLRNYADEALWEEVKDYPNVYRCKITFDRDVGIIAFDHSKIQGDYEGIVGIKKNPDEILRFKDAEPFTGISDLDENLEFYHDLSDKQLYLYCTKGNPGRVYQSIEIGDKQNIVAITGNDITIDNLCICYGGAHGVGTGYKVNLTVTNNVFCWIGGSILTGYGGGNHTRYGNAVEIYGGVDGYYVRNNLIYQIYDTAITHQFSKKTGDCIMKNIEYSGNLIELCNWSVEYYNREADDGSKRMVSNVHVHDNFCRNAGYGWGDQRPDKCATHCNSFIITENTDHFVIENNIFDRSKYHLVRLNEGGDRKVVFRNNTYIQEENKNLGYIFGETRIYDRNVENTIKELYKEENPTVIFLKS